MFFSSRQSDEADDVDALGAGVADQAVPHGEAVAAEIAGDARAVRDGDVLQGGADDLLAEGGGVGDADGIVGGLLAGGHGVALALDLEGAIGVLREGEAAQGVALAVGRLAVHRRASSRMSALSKAVISIWRPAGSLPDVDITALVVDGVGARRRGRPPRTRSAAARRRRRPCRC